MKDLNKEHAAGIRPEEEQQMRKVAEKIMKPRKEKLENKKTEIRKKRSDLQQLDEEKKKKEENVKRLKEHLENKNTEVKTLEDAIAKSWKLPWNSKEEQQQKKKKDAEKELENLKKQLETEEPELATKTKQIEDKQAEVKKLQEEIQEMENNLKPLMEKLESNNEKWENKFKEEKKKREKEVEDQNTKFNNKQAEVQQLQEEIQKMETDLQTLMEDLESDNLESGGNRTSQVQSGPVQSVPLSKWPEVLRQKFQEKLQKKITELEEIKQAADRQSKKTNESDGGSPSPGPQGEKKQNSSSFSQNSTTGPAVVFKVDRHGEYIQLRNTSTEVQQLGGWDLKIQVNKEEPVIHTFKDSFNLKAGKVFTVGCCSCDRSFLRAQLVLEDLKPWRHTDTLQVSLISHPGEIQYNLDRIY